MRPIVVATTDASGGATSSPIVAIDTWTDPVNVAVAVVVTGTVNFTTQYTYDDISAPTFSVATATWFPLAALTAKIATTEGFITQPVTAVRTVQNSGNGSTLTTVLQAGGNGSW